MRQAARTAQRGGAQPIRSISPMSIRASCLPRARVSSKATTHRLDTESMLVVAIDVAHAANDKQWLEPMLKVLARLPEALGSVTHLLTDNGYFSAANVESCVNAKIEPLLAARRDAHHPHWEDKFTEPPTLTEPTSDVVRMKHQLKTNQGGALNALRKQTVEPVFGITCVR